MMKNPRAFMLAVVAAVTLPGLVVSCSCTGSGNEAWGSFGALPPVVFCQDDRSMILQDDFSYQDASGKTWQAHQYDVVNGSSIPSVLWGPVFGSPFIGPHRNASILHDIACIERVEPSREVHRMYYEACRCAGMGRLWAKLFYGAVYVFGPSWTLPADRGDEIACDPVHQVPKWAGISVIKSTRVNSSEVFHLDDLQHAMPPFESFHFDAARLSALGFEGTERDDADRESLESQTKILNDLHAYILNEDPSLQELAAFLDK